MKASHLIRTLRASLCITRLRVDSEGNATDYELTDCLRMVFWLGEPSGVVTDDALMRSDWRSGFCLREALMVGVSEAVLVEALVRGEEPKWELMVALGMVRPSGTESETTGEEDEPHPSWRHCSTHGACAPCGERDCEMADPLHYQDVDDSGCPSCGTPWLAWKPRAWEVRGGAVEAGW